MYSLNNIGTTFLLINVVMILFLPRRLAPLPLIAGACWMTLGQGIKIGAFHFPVIRILIATGLARVIIRGERLADGMNGLDRLMLVWSAWGLISSVFHKDPSAALVFRLGFIYNTSGVYFLFRIFCTSIENIKTLCMIVAIVLMPVAVEMVYESQKMYNLFSMLGGIHEIPTIREGRVRANGPFSHSILAGTVGATMIPLMIGLWKQNRKIGLMGLLSCFSMIIACASSGPILSAMMAFAALSLWHHRQHIKLLRWFAVLGYIALDIVMNDPAYFILARIGTVGGSTGWHRAQLIKSSMIHLNEWWLAGTDYTRHWMPTGVSWSPDHTDITNYYLHLGVIGGLPLMFLFIAILAKGFSFVGQTLRQSLDLPEKFRFMLWAFGASLFAHAATSMSVSYFDQSFLFLFLILAAIGSAHSAALFDQASNHDGRRIKLDAPARSHAGC